MNPDNPMMQEIMREMLRTAFERVGAEILRKHPEFTPEEMRAEAARLTTIYLENYDRESNSFDMEMIQRMTGIQFMAPESE